MEYFDPTMRYVQPGKPRPIACSLLREKEAGISVQDPLIVGRGRKKIPNFPILFLIRPVDSNCVVFTPAGCPWLPLPA